ncbi:sulfite exporter TauE/SafE family protein [Flagellimonas sp. 2504JD1-5]
MLVRYLPLFIILSILSEVLGTVGGFGSSVFFVPLANNFMDFQSVLGITALFHLSSNITKIAFFKKGFDKQLAIYLGIPAIVFVSLGAIVSKYVDPKLLIYALGCFLIALSLVFILKKDLIIQATKKNAFIGGTLSGFFAGILGTGGAIRGITMAAFNLKKEKFIATSAIIDLGIDFNRSIFYTYYGYVHKHDLYLIPILILVGIIGTFLGKQILDKMSQNRFKRIVLYLILGIGLSTILLNTA